jgi:2-amino-4-hydroxy-6-hydroxymethyldihydropteridine diphosphokinase
MFLIISKILWRRKINKSFIVFSLGSNLGDRLENLRMAERKLGDHFLFQDATDIFETDPVDFEDQPKFLNQLLQYEYPGGNPEQILELIQNIELEIGRTESFEKGPRIIDIDIIFINDLKYHSSNLTIPHPEVFNRDFILCLLPALAIFPKLKEWFDIEEKKNEFILSQKFDKNKYLPDDARF